MNAKRPQNNLRWASIVALAFLSGGLLGLVRQQFLADHANATRVAHDELELLATIAQDMLNSQRDNEIPRILQKWGEHTPDVLELRVTTAQNKLLGMFQRTRASAHTYHFEATVNTLPGTSATIQVTKDFSTVYDLRNVLALQLAIAFSAVAVLLAYLARMWKLRQRETAALNHANAALQTENQQRREAESALFEAKERAEVTVRSIADGVITTDRAGVIQYLNPVAERLLGWTMEEAQGKDIAQILVTLNERTRQPQENPISRTLATGIAVKPSDNMVLVQRNQREVPIEDSSAPLRDQDGNIIGAVLVLHDVSASRELANRLSWQATHDALTGLINRREFDYRLTQATLDAHSEHSEHALLYIDLDQFKTVNDLCGHVAGDVLLQQISTLMQNHMRANDTLARLGGDEFGILLMNCPLAKAREIADSVLRCIREFRFVWERKPFEIGASIGLVMITRNSGDLAAILYAADVACYTAKEQGRGRTFVYPEGAKLPAKGLRNRIHETTLIDALARNKFVLYGQAIKPLHAAQKNHCEVLLRLRNTKSKILLPGHFLPSADRHDLMPAIDQWVINKALTKYAKYLRSTQTKDFCLHINISSASLAGGEIAGYIHGLIRRHRIPPGRLCFDIDESVALSRLTQALGAMRDLRDMGCLLTLDDFGAGMSSFGYLKSLPVNFVNIASELITQLVDEPVNRAVVASVVSICKPLGITTIAKHVSNDQLLEIVTEAGVDYAQGLAVGAAHPLDEYFKLHFDHTEGMALPG
ncbi:MAG: EAL domain-containing protein [Pseudomonadota bacterium]